jgi:hydrogenase-4 component E
VTPLLFALQGVLLVPLFVSSWRMSLFGLSLQGFLMAWIAQRLDPSWSTANAWLTCGDLGLVRGVLAPLALYGVLRRQNAAARNDVIPPNLVSWALALGLVLAAFNFSELLVTQPGEQQTLVAVAAGAILIGFLILATQSDPLSQMIGVLRIENGIALFELGAEPQPHEWGVQLAQVVLSLATLLLFRTYLRLLGTGTAAQLAQPSPEGPTL